MNYKVRLLFVGLSMLIEAGWAQIGCENSTLAANLNITFLSLYTNVDNRGFYNASFGQGIDRANAMVMCRGDAEVSACRACILKNAARVLNSSCPIAVEATRYDTTGGCIMRYSNDTTYGAGVDTRPSYYQWNGGNASNVEQYEAVTRMLLDDLTNKAASGGSLRKVAAGNRTGPDFLRVFGMVQCTPNLSTQECARCLIRATAEIPLHCAGKKGCRVFWPSCNLGFDEAPIFDGARLQELETALIQPPSQPQPQPQPPPSPGKNDDGNNTRIAIAVVVPVVACLILAVSAIIFLRKKRKQKPMEDTHVDEIGAPESLQYLFSTIKAATNDFSEDNKLGQGGFGAVYKGKLPNDESIAVKRLSKNSGQGDLEFKNEVVLLAKLQHRNLVRLMGFSLEKMEKILVYEFVQNASLDHFIFDPINHTYLNWERRYKIIAGIARGILYLHEDSRLRIIHRDLKASNILLDRELNPKIADFGMARLFGQDETHANTNRVVGTYGYMAPEYVMHGQFSIKSDVFSFGVLVLEIINGRKNSSYRSEENAEDLLSYAWKNWRDGVIENVVDPLLKSSSGSISEMMRCINIGLLCVQENAGDRPTMASVVLMLSSFSMPLSEPSEPAFYFSCGNGSDVSHQQNSRNSECSHSSKQVDKSDHSSQNEASISDLYPR